MDDRWLYLHDDFLAHGNDDGTLTLKIVFPHMPTDRDALAADFDKLSRLPDLLPALRSLPELLSACVELHRAGRNMSEGDDTFNAAGRFFVADKAFIAALRKAGVTL